MKTQNKELAERIARLLFTDGFGRHADRLEMKHDDRRGGEVSGAGWCESAVSDRIEGILNEAIK